MGTGVQTPDPRCDKVPKLWAWWRLSFASARRLVRMAPFALDRHLVLELQSRSLEEGRETVSLIRARLARLLLAPMEACLLLPLLGRGARPCPLEPRC